jgi:protocatechuate 3,4-dioxygenase alpha subunit
VTTRPTTPSQTVGPYLSIAMNWGDDGPQAVPFGTPGAVWIRGRLLDGAGQPITDGMIETWQADPDGRFNHPDDPRGAVARPGFRGFGRSLTDQTGEFAIHTLKPGPLPDGEGGRQAPHLDVSVFARGLMERTITRIYFGDEPVANSRDAVLRSLPDDAARATLIAAPAADGYRLDLVLQGDHETVFFAL